MFPEDQTYDWALWQMAAAFDGPTEPWRRLNLALRDGIVDYAASRSPFYERLVQRAGGEFESLPVLTKATVRENFDDILARGVPEERVLFSTTSGSSGEPLSFARDLAQGPLEEGSGQRCLRRLHGIPPEAATVWLAANPHASANVVAVRLRDFTPERLARELPAWEALGTYFLYGHASALEWVAERIEAWDLVLRVPPVCIVTTSDVLAEQAAHRIGRAFERPVHSWYGSHEFNGFLAGTLPGSRCYAFNPLLSYMEVLDEEGQPCDPGRSGHLVITDLNNRVFPFIRYDTGDLAVPSGHGHVGGWPLLDNIEGRGAERLVLPSGRILSGAVMGQFLFHENKLDRWIRLYQCAHTGPNELELRVVWGAPHTPESENRIKECVRSLVDPGMEVRIRSVRELDRLPSGKAWLIRREFEPA